MQNNDLMIKISADTKKAVEQIEELKKEIKTFATNTKKANKSLQEQSSSLNKLKGSIKGVVGAYLGFQAVKSVISTVGDFEQSIAKLHAISGASSVEMDTLKQKAMELGKSTQYSASQVAEGMNYLAMAGYKTSDIMASMNDVLNLATIGQVDLAQASDIASNILSGFGLSAEETKRVVDDMTVTITNANTNIPEMGEAMKYVAPQAKALGISVEETSAAIGVLGNAGIKATMAGTGLSTMMVRLAAPVSRGREALKELGIQTYDASGKFLGFTNVLKQFSKKTKSLSQEQKASYYKDIFGIETLKSAMTLIDSVDTSYAELYSKIQNSNGASADKVKIMMDTFNGHLKELQSAFEGLILVVGNELLPALTDFTKWLTETTSDTIDFYSENKELINTVAKLATTFFLLKKAFVIYEALLGAGAVAKMALFAVEMKKLGSVVEMLSFAFSKLSKANVVLLGLTAAIIAMNYVFDEWEDRLKKSEKATGALVESSTSFKEILNELDKSLEIKNGVKSFRLTANELERLKAKTLGLMQINEAKIAQLKKDKELTEEQKQILKSLVAQNKSLHGVYNKLEKQKPYEETAKSADNAKKAVLRLSKEEKKLYKNRVREHSKTVSKLEKKERELASKILNIQKELQRKLKDIETSRLNALEDINSKIHSINMSGASDYEKYVDAKKQAEIAFNKAKAALRNGDLSQAKRYMGQYESLIVSSAEKEERLIEDIENKKKKANERIIKLKEKLSELYTKETIANNKRNYASAALYAKKRQAIEKEILKLQEIGNKKIAVSKKQVRENEIKGLNKLKSLTNSYYAQEKAQARASANAKLQQLRAQLQATKAQMQLEVQRLNLEKQLIEAVTGKKVDIDTKEALASIKTLDKQIKELDNKTKKKKDLKVSADTKEAKSRVGKLNQDIKKAKPKLIIHGDIKLAQSTLKKFNVEVKNTKPVVTVKSDVSQALKSINSIPKSITTVHYIKTVETHATGGSVGAFERKSGRIAGYDASDSDDVPALLTRGEFVIKRDAVSHYGDDFLHLLNNRMLPKFATGGLVGIGKTRELVQQLNNKSSSSNNNSDSNSESLSSLDDLKEKIEVLKDLADTLAGLKSPLVDTIKKSTKSGETLVKKYENDINHRQEALSKQKETQDSVKGKVQSKEEYKKFSQKLKTEQGNVKKATALTKADEKKAKAFEKKVDKIAKDVQKYLDKVEKAKERVKGALQHLGVSEYEVLPSSFDDSLDLKKIAHYYNKLKKIKVSSVSSIQQSLVRRAMRLNRTGWTNSMIARSVHPSVRISGDSLNFHVEVPQSAAEKIRLERIKAQLPKFQTGGLIALQNGGKLPGYGGGDRNLALLEDGEFVVRKEAVGAFGSDLFHRLNNLELPKFQSGGVVGALPIVGSGASANDTNINFTMPSGNSYSMMSSSDVAKKLSEEFRRLL